MEFIADYWIAGLMIAIAIATLTGAFTRTAAMLPVSRAIDAVSIAVGKVVMWLVLVAVLVSTYNAVQRYAFNISSNAWLEIQWYLFGAVFLLAAAYTLQRNEHIRIDVVASALSARARSWIDLVGHVLFLTPFTILMVHLSVPWVIFAYERGEVSANAGGLIRWPAKALLVLGFALLFAQAMSEIVKRVAVLRGVIADPNLGHDAAAGVVEGAVAMEGHGAPAIDTRDRAAGATPRENAARENVTREDARP